MTYAGNLENLSDIDTSSHYTFIKANIIDREAIEQIFKSKNIDMIVNFTAEFHIAHEDRTIEEP